MNRKTSEALYEEALKYIPGGVNSPVRAFQSVGACPVFAARAKGSRLVDVDGNSYLDYITSWGPLVMGHCPDFIQQDLQKAAQYGISFGLATAVEVEMAKTVVESYPSIDMVRMVNSGTEATMSAVRASRGYTGRDKVVKFEGCYHGHSDGMLVGSGSGALTFSTPTSPGVPRAVVQDTLLCTYNDLDSVREAFRRYPGQIAAVILEPVAANMGVVLPVPGFLEGLRELTLAEGAVLIFDEVITGFRLALGGAAEYFGVEPDMACFGKIIGAGLPVGAYGGKREIMELVSPAGPVYQAGTLSGNPLAMSLGLSMLKKLRAEPETYEKLSSLARRLAEGLRAHLKEAGLSYTVTQIGSLVCLFFTEGEIKSYEGVKKCDTQQFSRYHKAMLDQGILTAPSQFEAMFISAAHTREDIDFTLECSRKAFRSLLGK